MKEQFEEYFKNIENPTKKDLYDAYLLGKYSIISHLGDSYQSYFISGGTPPVKEDGWLPDYVEICSCPGSDYTAMYKKCK